MKKICIFCGFYPLVKGGAEYQSKIISEKLSDSGYDVFFISFGHNEDSIISYNGFKIYTFRNPSKFDTFSLYERIGRKVSKVIDTEKPDIIYQRILNSYTPHLARITKKRSCRLYIHIADNYSLKFGSDLRSCVRRLFFSRIRRYIENGSKINYIAQTNWQFKRLQELGIKPCMRIYNMHPIPSDEVDSDLKLDGLSFLENDKKNVFWVANIRPVKRLDLLLKIAERHPNLNFIVIGRSSECASSDILRSGTFDNVFYLGERDNEFINKIFYRSTLLINTSDSEGFSNTFIQAWMRGVPVLSLNSDPDGLIEKHELGFFADGDLNSLEDSMVENCLNEEKRTLISLRCRDIAQDMFSSEINFKRLLAKFKEN